MSEDVVTESDAGGGGMVQTERLIAAEFFIYVPLPDDFRSLAGWTGGSDDPVTLDDEHAYVKEKLAGIYRDLREMSGNAGNLSLHDPKLVQPERIPDDERWDDEFDTNSETGALIRSLWYGMMIWTIR